MMGRSNCLSELLTSFEASIKSFTKNRFVPMVIRYVSMNEALEEIMDPSLANTLSVVITKKILGHAGNFVSCKGEDDEDDQEDEDDDDQDDEDNDSTADFKTNLEDAVQKWKRKSTSNVVSSKSREIIENLKQMSNEKLRSTFLPPHFKHLVTDIKTEPGWKASFFPHKIFLVLRFFSDVNKMSLPGQQYQLVFPTPNTKARYVKVTTTILSHMWISYLKTEKGRDIENSRGWMKAGLIPGRFSEFSCAFINY